MSKVAGVFYDAEVEVCLMTRKIVKEACVAYQGIMQGNI